MALDELDQMIKFCELGKLAASWDYRTSPIEKYENGLPVVKAVGASGKSEERPMFFVGYGGFADVVRDLRVFQHSCRTTIIPDGGCRSIPN